MCYNAVVQIERKAIELTAEKKKKEKAPKPKYNMWQNVGFMVKTAWIEKEKKVLVTTLFLAVLSVINSLIGLYVTPVLLGQVESGVSPMQLVLTAVSFTLALMLCGAVTAYIRECEMYGKISTRCALINAINEKGCRTSFPNLEDEKFIKLSSKASNATCGNSQATEAIWGTVQSLITNIAGFVIYLVMLTNVDPLLIAVILATTLVGYFINKQLSGYSYSHRDEEGEIENKLNYSAKLTQKQGISKDIRIFNMRHWLEELYTKALDAYTSFKKRESNIVIWGSIADLVLTFLRGGVAYFYLINMVIGGGLSVSQFLLYFSTVGGFTAWVSGILGGFTTLHRQSLDISSVREFIEYPELFKYSDGKPLDAGQEQAVRNKARRRILQIPCSREIHA